MAAGFDQSRHQQGIQHAIGFLDANVLVQACTIGWWWQRAESNPPRFQNLVDLFEMVQFFSGDRSERSHQFLTGGIAKHQIQRHSCRFSLTVRVIEQNYIQVSECLVKPRLGCRLLQKPDRCWD